MPDAIAIPIAVPAEPVPQRQRRREPRPPRPVYDFSVVDPRHREIHMRLENWAIWARTRYAPASAPGFERYQSPSVVDRHGRVLAQRRPTAVDPIDAQRIAAAVHLLPEPHRKALNWFYLKGTSPKRGCEEVGATMEYLHRLIHDGRQMLVNRSV